MKSKVFSVTQINTYIKRMFQSDYALRRISIKGQVSNCKYHSSGHIYFSLKDEESQISCVMFASARYNGLQFELEDGQEVIVDGNVSVYERGGSYQLYAQEIRGTLIVVLICCAWHIASAFLLNGTGLYFLGMPAWFSVSTFGTIILSLIGVWYLLKHVFINFEYDDEEEGEE